MAETVNFKVDFGEAAGWEPYSGFGAAALLKKDGNYKGLILSATPAVAKSGNHKFDLAIQIVDEDEKGQVIYGQVMASGKDKNGKALSRQLWDLIASFDGMTPEKIKALAANGTQDAAAVAGLIKGKTCHMQVEAESYTDQQTGKTSTTSRPQNYITAAKYTESVTIGAHRRERATMASVAAPAGATAIAQPNFGAAPAVGGAAAPISLNGVGAAPAAAADPLAQLKALGL